MGIDTIIAQATESVNVLVSQGWKGSGNGYDLGTYFSDAEALAEKLGRTPTRDERASLENQIRRQLDERFEAVSYDQIAALRSEAATASDMAQVAICDRALDDELEAIGECARVIAAARAQE